MTFNLELFNGMFGIVSIIVIFSLFVLLTQSVDGRTMETIQSMVYQAETFKIFEDGVTYTEECVLKKGYDCAIIHEGVEYPCEFNRMHGGMITPMCIEIILKTKVGNDG